MENNNNNLPARTENLLLTTQFVNFKGREIVRASFGVKIKDLDPSQDEPIKQVLRYIFALIGLKADNLPSDLQKAVLIDFIRSELGHFTLEDFKIAFTLAIKGETGAEINHFQNFSSLYLAQVLNAYQEHRNKAISEFRRAEERRLQEERDKKGPTPEEINEINRSFDLNCVVDPFNQFLKTGLIEFGHVPISLIYQSLSNRHKVLVLSNQEKQEIRKKAEEELIREMNRPAQDLKEHKRMKSVRDLIVNQGIETQETDIVRKCHEIAVTEFFAKLKIEGRDLTELLNLKTQDSK